MIGNLDLEAPVNLIVVLCCESLVELIASEQIFRHVECQKKIKWFWSEKQIPTSAFGLVFQNKAHGQTYYAVSENLLYVIVSFHQMSSAYFWHQFLMVRMHWQNTGVQFFYKIVSHCEFWVKLRYWLLFCDLLQNWAISENYKLFYAK